MDSGRPTRLLLVGGPGGGGSSTYAAQLADAAGDRPVVLVALDDVFGAAALSTSPHVERLTVSASQTGLDAGLHAFLDTVGLNPRVLSEAAFVPSASITRLLWQLGEFHAPDDALIIVDAGAQIAELCLAAHQFAWLAHELLPAQRGWLSSARPLVAAGIGKRWPGSAAYEQARRAWAAFSAARELILRSDAHLIDRQATSPEKVRQLARGLRLAGVANVVRPNGVGGGGELVRRASPINIEITEVEGGWDWRMPLPDFAIDQLKLEHIGDDLVLQGYGYRRVITLSSAFQRVAPTGAHLVDGMLTIRFRPPKETAS